jgi:hypothetical protein
MEQAATLTPPNAAYGSLARRKHRRRVSRFAFRFVEATLAFAFIAAVVHHVVTLDFKPLAAFCIPILVLFFGFASLLYTRGRSLARTKGQIRSLYAAEHAVQATIWHMAGIIVGTSLYGVLTRYGVTSSSGELSAAQLWLLLFLAPYALMQIGLLCFMRAVWIVAPHFFRRLRAAEFRRKVQ